MQYPSTLEPNFYIYHNNGIVYAISDSKEQYSCGSEVNITKDNCPYILVTLSTRNDDESETIYVHLYLDYLITVGDRYTNNDRVLPCNGNSFLDVLLDLQRHDIVDMVLQGYNITHIESVIPYYLKTTTSDVHSGVTISGYSPYIYLRGCSYHEHKDSNTVINLIENTPININDPELWQDIALSEAQKTASKILTLCNQESKLLTWVS